MDNTEPTRLSEDITYSLGLRSQKDSPVPQETVTHRSHEEGSLLPSSQKNPPQLDSNPWWSDKQPASPGAPQLLRINQLQNRRRISHPSHIPSSIPNMSAVAMPFDPRMEMGVPRSTFTWPAFESDTDTLGNDLYSIGPSSDASLTPPIGSRSITSSPPIPTLTAEQRELKRQRDLARRGSKTTTRTRRAMSGYRSSQSPPMSVSEYTAAPAMSVSTTAPTQLSLLAEPVTSVSGASYIPAYSSSPSLSDQQSAMFSPPYDYMGMTYPSAFPDPSASHSLPSHYRPSPANDHSIMYPPAPVLSSGSGLALEPNHVRVVQTRPKPQCWEHGCNGRQFSTFSNLLRHQREKSGQASKSVCPNCGAEFTRTTARNGHLLHDKCKQRKNSV